MEIQRITENERLILEAKLVELEALLAVLRKLDQITPEDPRYVTAYRPIHDSMARFVAQAISALGATALALVLAIPDQWVQMDQILWG